MTDLDKALRSLLVEAIDQWMKVPTDQMQYHHGNAQGIARAMAIVDGTSFSVEWEKGLDAYQNRVVLGE